MSTINIVDWINSLSESELEEQLVLAVDGQTPTKGNSADKVSLSDIVDDLNSTSVTKPLSANQGKQLNDDKASLSGGSDANFNVMPQVGGSPIVEKDSNDDGEWVRFSNGFQVCYKGQVRLTRESSQSRILSSPTFQYPSPFVKIGIRIAFIDPLQAPTVYPLADTDGPARNDSAYGGFLRTNTLQNPLTEAFIYIVTIATMPSDYDENSGGWLAIGNWK